MTFQTAITGMTCRVSVAVRNQLIRFCSHSPPCANASGAVTKRAYWKCVAPTHVAEKKLGNGIENAVELSR